MPSRGGRSRPDNATYQNSLGIAYAQVLRAKEAILAFRRALKLRPRYPQALNNLALQLRAAGEYDEAEVCYKSALELSPAALDTHINLASLYQSQGRVEAAERQFDLALALKPGYLKALSARLLNDLYRTGIEPAALRARAQQCAALLEHRPGAAPRRHANSPDSDRRV